jgi:hypothetical protein
VQGVTFQSAVGPKSVEQSDHWSDPTTTIKPPEDVLTPVKLTETIRQQESSRGLAAGRALSLVSCHAVQPAASVGNEAQTLDECPAAPPAAPAWQSRPDLGTCNPHGGSSREPTRHTPECRCLSGQEGIMTDTGVPE